MFNKRKKGVTLILVIIIMAVFTILGTSLMMISLSQVKQTVQEQKRIQAQFLAKSGAEAALGAWKAAKSTATILPSGTANTVYLDNTNNFVSSAASYKGKFDTTISYPSNQVIITSVGTVDNVSQTTTVTINISSHTTQIPSTGVEMSTKGWYEANGQVKVANPPAENTIDAIIDPPSGNSIIKMVHLNAVWQARSIDFKVDIWNFKENFTLKSDLIIFEKLIDFSHGGSIVLLTNPGETRVGHGTNLYGKIQYGGIWYWFLNGTTFTGDLMTQLDDPLTSGDIPTLGSTVLINDYTIKWD